MGFNAAEAAEALRQTNCSSIEAAIDCVASGQVVLNDVDQNNYDVYLEKINEIKQTPVEENVRYIEGPNLEKKDSDYFGEIDEEYKDEYTDFTEVNEYLKNKEERNRDVISLQRFYGKDMEVLSRVDVMKELTATVDEVCETLSVPYSIAVKLLERCGWLTEKLYEKWFDNERKLLKECKIDPSSLHTDSNKQVPQELKDGTFMCFICGSDEIKLEGADSLECGHWFCNDCWDYYVSDKIKDGITTINCMMSGCHLILEDSKFVKRHTPTDVYEKYCLFLVKNFTQNHQFLHFCPAPDCEFVLKNDGARHTLKCKCGKKFCPRCSSEGHFPCSCDTLEKWKKKCADDSETYNWLNVNTQSCPKCKVSIEKNGGCNHMTCWKCRNDFCWICGSNWSGHTTCNKLKEAGDKDSAKDSLERYLHYFHRWNVHANSRKFESKLRETAIEKMIRAFDTQNMNNIKVIDDATENLIECRRTLQYTYVYAFALSLEDKHDKEKNLFEFLQADLEKTTEELSHYLENEDGTVNLSVMRQKSNNAAQKLLHLLEGVEEGLTKGLKVTKKEAAFYL